MASQVDGTMITALKRLKQEDWEFKDSVAYLETSRPAWTKQ